MGSKKRKRPFKKDLNSLLIKAQIINYISTSIYYIVKLFREN